MKYAPADPTIDECPDCWHIHGAKFSGGNVVDGFLDHGDICDCTTEFTVCALCGAVAPDDRCDRERCDDPRIA